MAIDSGRQWSPLTQQAIIISVMLLLSALLSELLPNIFEDTEAIAELRTHLGEGCHIEGSITVQKVAGNFPMAV